MEIILSAEEVRVGGALIEKQLSTPDYYPLSLNALVNACNQLSNREPVVSYDERTVLQAIDSLRAKNLAKIITGADNRVPKYAHLIDECLDLAVQEVAVLCVLMLRGAQTVGEVRGRSGRLYDFADLNEVELTLQGLVEHQPVPLVVKLPRQPGTKESRYAHRLSGHVEVEEQVTTASSEVSRPQPQNSFLEARVESLELEVGQLKQELAELKQQLSEFKQQFE